MRHYDLIVVGGGINGVGVAADAAGRGLKVLLCEQNDLASGTSSTSSKLIHGGLRYLEHYEFRLVKEALAEREVLLSKAPHLVNPLKFVLPHCPHLRPVWMIRAGLFLYDHLSKRNHLPGAKQLEFDHKGPFKPSITKGFEYFDCWVDDSRLVVLNAMAAREAGAEIRTQSKVLGVQHDPVNKRWEVSMQTASGATEGVTCQGVVNAAGPWLNQFINDAVTEIAPPRIIRLIKGSHIVVPRVPNGDAAYILQNEDKRIVFVLPFEDDYSIVGTTDKEYKGDLAAIKIDQDEIDYLLGIYNDYFKVSLSEEDIVHSYSGVRPLCNDESDDPSAITRDYTVETTHRMDNPFVSIYGGKITTYRKLSEAVLDELSPYFPDAGEPWTSQRPLPGAEAGTTREHILKLIQNSFPWLPEVVAARYARSYGLLSMQFLQGKKSIEHMGLDFGHGLYQAEVDYLAENEWANCAEDILWRRTKMGLRLDADQTRRLESHLGAKLIRCA